MLILSSACIPAHVAQHREYSRSQIGRICTVRSDVRALLQQRTVESNRTLKVPYNAAGFRCGMDIRFGKWD